MVVTAILVAVAAEVSERGRSFVLCFGTRHLLYGDRPPASLARSLVYHM